jgi:hypothetical protein
MAQAQHTPELLLLEEAIITLFCEIDDAYAHLNPKGQHYATLKQVSDSEVLTLALFSSSFEEWNPNLFPLRETARFFSHLFPGVLGLHPSSFHRRIRKLRRHLEPLRRAVLPELVGEPETLIVDSTLLEVLHPRQVSQSAGFDGAAWVRWGTFSVYGVKLHLLCATNRVPVSYELTSANVADIPLTKELLGEAGLSEGEVARRLLGDLAYRSEELKEELAEVGILLATEKAERRSAVRQQVEIAISSLKRVFGLGEKTLARSIIGLVSRIAAKITAYTYAFLVNRRLGRPQGKIKELWA